MHTGVLAGWTTETAKTDIGLPEEMAGWPEAEKIERRSLKNVPCRGAFPARPRPAQDAAGVKPMNYRPFVDFPCDGNSCYTRAVSSLR
jgi:hypothetical protein